ncbi:MAG TPA: CPBP family intramembrane glutamic endopeptidase [Candidatus Dormibacteraeota bacterium]
MKAAASRRSLPLVLAAAAVAIEWARTLGMGVAPLAAGAAGGALLLALAAGSAPERLGLAPGRWGPRLIGAAALTVVLLLPAAVRWTGAMPLSGWFAVVAAVIAIGEEVAYRGVLFAALEEVWGGAVAVVGSAAAFALAHALSHPVAFLPAVFAAGLVLGVWRWLARDLVAPIAAHFLADFCL